MTEREKLKDLLEKAIRYADVNYGGRIKEGRFCELMSDFILSNGVIVPPCKVEDNLFYPWEYDGISGVAVLEVFALKIYVQGRTLVSVKNPESDMYIPRDFLEEDFGKTVFLTKEEAEKALKERSEKE